MVVRVPIEEAGGVLPTWRLAWNRATLLCFGRNRYPLGLPSCRPLPMKRPVLKAALRAA